MLGEAELPSPELGARLTDCRARLAEVDRARRDGAQRLADAADHREAHGKVLDAVRTLAGGEIAAQTAHAAALERLRRHRELRALADRAPAIARELDAARKLAGRQS